MTQAFGWCIAPLGIAPKHAECRRVIDGVYCGCEVATCDCSKNPREEVRKKGVQDAVDAL